MSEGSSESTRRKLSDKLTKVRSDGRDGAESTGRSRRDGGRGVHDGDQSYLFRTFISVVAGWMVLGLVLLFAIGMWSCEMYFIVSFHGLLGARLLLAPKGRAPGWWRVVNWVVYAGFAVLGYVLLP